MFNQLAEKIQNRPSTVIFALSFKCVCLQDSVTPVLLVKMHIFSLKMKVIGYNVLTPKMGICNMTYSSNPIYE